MTTTKLGLTRGGDMMMMATTATATAMATATTDG